MTFDDHTNRNLLRLEGHLRFYKTTTLILLVLVVLLAAILIIGGRRKFARGIRIDGELICLVKDQRAAERVHEKLLANGRGELPGEASLEQQWEVVALPVDDSEVLSVSEAVERLTPRVTVLVAAYTIQVDGKPTVNLPSEDFASRVLDALKHSYLQEDEKLVEPQTFLQDVTIAPVRAEASTVVTDIATAREQLSRPTTEAKTYTVKPGDYPESIAAHHGMTQTEFYELNPETRGNVIHPGDVVKVAAAVSGITVKTVKEVTRTEEVPPEVERPYSASVPKGQTEVAMEGEPGERLVVEHHTYHNDKLVGKKEVDSRITKAPSPRRVLVGTGDAPPEGGDTEE